MARWQDVADASVWACGPTCLGTDRLEAAALAPFFSLPNKKQQRAAPPKDLATLLCPSEDGQACNTPGKGRI